MNIVNRILRMAEALGHPAAEVGISRPSACGDAAHQWYVAVRAAGQPLLASTHARTIDEGLANVDGVLEKMTRVRANEAIAKAKVFTDALLPTDTSGNVK